MLSCFSFKEGHLVTWRVEPSQFTEKGRWLNSVIKVLAFVLVCRILKDYQGECWCISRKSYVHGLLLLPLNTCRTGSHRVGLIGQTKVVLEKQVGSHEESTHSQGCLILLISCYLPPLLPWSKWFLSLRASCFPISSFPDLLSIFSQLFQVLIGGLVT